MATPRRLINKKAYEELVLLRKFCNDLELRDNKKSFFPFIAVHEDDFSEGFGILIMNKMMSHIIDDIEGKNYTEISKALMEYLNDK